MSSTTRVLPLLSIAIVVLAGCTDGITTPGRSPLSVGLGASPCPIGFFPSDDYALGWPTLTPARSIAPSTTVPTDVELLVQGGDIRIQSGCAPAVSPPARTVDLGSISTVLRDDSLATRGAVPF